MDSGRFSGMQFYQLVPAITTVTTNLACEDRTVTVTVHFRFHARHSCQVYMILLLQGEGIVSLILRRYMHIITEKHWQFLSTRPPPPTHMQFLFARSILSTTPAVFVCWSSLLFLLLILTPEGLTPAPHQCFYPKSYLFFCVL